MQKDGIENIVIDENFLKGISLQRIGILTQESTSAGFHLTTRKFELNGNTQSSNVKKLQLTKCTQTASLFNSIF